LLRTQQKTLGGYFILPHPAHSLFLIALSLLQYENIATPMHSSTAAVIPLYRLNIWWASVQ